MKLLQYGITIKERDPSYALADLTLQDYKKNLDRLDVSSFGGSNVESSSLPLHDVLVLISCWYLPLYLQSLEFSEVVLREYSTHFFVSFPLRLIRIISYPLLRSREYSSSLVFR